MKMFVLMLAIAVCTTAAQAHEGWHEGWGGGGGGWHEGWHDGGWGGGGFVVPMPVPTPGYGYYERPADPCLRWSHRWRRWINIC